MFVNFNILNQLGSPAINSNTFANRPAAGQTGRLFVSTDTFEIYRDNGTTWDLIGGPGTSTITGTGTATQVAYFTSSQAIGSSANLFWDNTNSFLGIGTAAPTAGVHVVDTDAFGMYSQITTVAGTAATSVGLYAKNTTNFAGYAAIFDENTPNSAAGQYPILIRHSLSSGTAAANMATGIHFGLPDDAGTERINQFSMDTTDPAAATYSSRYRFLLRNNGSAVTPFYITGTGIGVFTATPGAALDIHSTGIMAQLNSTSATANSLLAFQRSGNGLWRIGDTYNGGNNFFELHNTVLTNNAIQVLASSNEATFLSGKTYTTGNSIGIAVQHNLTIPNGTNVGLAALGGVNSLLNLTLGGSTTVANTGRQGLEGSTTISFSGAGTLTMTQGTTVRAFSALSSVYAFNGSAVGTITHLAGLRICFPDNVGSAVNITNNYALLINDQTTGTGTVTYTNRWGIYQEGASDLNYFAGNSLYGTTTNVGAKIAINGYMYISNRPLAQIVFNSTGTYYGQIQNDAADKWSFARNASNDGSLGTSIMTWDATSNNVGIGTTSPLYRVHVETNDNNFNIPTLIENTSSGTSAQTAFRIKGGSNTFTVGITSSTHSTNNAYCGSDQNTPTVFYTGNSYLFFQTNALERMRITSGGDIAIGTTFTNTRLNVFVDASSVNGLSLIDAGTVPAVFTYSTVTGENKIGGLLSYVFPTFYSGGSERARITTGGNFLIGTTTDAGQKLQVSGNGYFSANTASVQSVEIRNASASGFSVLTLSNTGASGRTYDVGVGGNTSGQNGNFYIFDNNAAATRMTINSSGNTEFGGSIKTAAPTTGTAANWKLGSRVAAAVALDATQYIEVDIAGTLYKLAIVT